MSAIATARRAPSRAPSRAPATRRPRLRVVRDQPRRHPLLFLSLYLLTAVGIVMGAVSLNALAAGDAVAVRELSDRLVVEGRDYDRLVAEVASLEDPVRLRNVAEGLGMVPAQAPRYLEPAGALPGDLPDEQADDRVKPLLSADR